MFAFLGKDGRCEALLGFQASSRKSTILNKQTNLFIVETNEFTRGLNIVSFALNSRFRFLLYINDLETSNGNSEITISADDTTLINAGKIVVCQHKTI